MKDVARSEHFSLRLPSGTRARADRLMQAIEAETQLAGFNIKRASVLTQALLEGLALLEERYSLPEKAEKRKKR